MEYLTDSGHWIKIDLEDAIKHGKLSVKQGNNAPYVWTQGGKALHRIVAGAKEGDHVDHINGDTLDNRKENLRCVNNRTNCQNNVLRRQGKTLSRYLGVTRTSSPKLPWRVRIYKNKEHTSHGSYANEHVAGLVYNVEMIDKFSLAEMGSWNLLSFGPTN